MNIGEGFALLEDSTGSGDYAPIEFDSNGKLYVKVLSADYNYTVSNDEGQSAGKMQGAMPGKKQRASLRTARSRPNRRQSASGRRHH